jgi:outer membrane protein OmpA-like peptidoglycan-associated protein
MKRFFLGWLVALILVQSSAADPLKFLYHKGDQYRYYGTVSQTVTLDSKFFQDNLLSYRIAFSVADTDSSGSGRLQGHITYLTEPRDNAAGAIAEEYDTEYQADSQGTYTVPDGQVMPVVRSVPTFPERELKLGDTWTGKGEEVHDLRKDFGVDSLLKVPFDVAYTYDGPSVRDGKTLQVIRSDYTLYKRTGFQSSTTNLFPILMAGYSHQTHYFNAEKGREEGYEEDYSLTLTMNTGQVLEYSGKGESHLVEAQSMDKPALVDEVKKGLEDRGLGNVQVQATPQGVSLNLDNILFPGDSADLMPSEQAKLKLIAEVLQRYPDRDILVEGHTAEAVSSVDPQKLSEERAAAVGNALVATGARRPDQIIYKGWGSTKPLVPNDTEEHRSKNRRVEITLMEN